MTYLTNEPRVEPGASRIEVHSVDRIHRTAGEPGFAGAERLTIDFQNREQRRLLPRAPAVSDPPTDVQISAALDDTSAGLAMFLRSSPWCVSPYWRGESSEW